MSIEHNHKTTVDACMLYHKNCPRCSQLLAELRQTNGGQVQKPPKPTEWTKIGRRLCNKSSEIGGVVFLEALDEIDRLLNFVDRDLKNALSELQKEPEPTEKTKEISLPSTNYIRTIAKFCRENVGLDDFFKTTAYDLERCASEIDRQAAENKDLKSLMEQLVFIAEKHNVDDSEQTTIELARRALKGE